VGPSGITLTLQQEQQMPKKKKKKKKTAMRVKSRKRPVYKKKA
jgi:hypothetical protein